jgi:lysophospholipase L1-like esterase
MTRPARSPQIQPVNEVPKMRISFIALGILGVSCSPVFAANKPAVNWVGTWAASPMACQVKSREPSAGDSTYRNVVRISIGGKGFRVQLTNEFGNSELMVGSAHLAIDSGDGTIKPGTDQVLTFGRRPAVTIPANGFMVSDEVSMDVPALSSLSISLYVTDQEIATRTCHELGTSTNYRSKGDTTAALTMTNARAVGAWNFVKGIEVRADKNAFAVVALGDSITDGYGSTKDRNHRWPDYLAERLQKNKNTMQVAVLNEGISGNRVLRNERGPNAIARFDRDVLAQSSVRYLILLEGINDINWDDASEDASAEQLITGVSQLVARAHAHGIIVFAATLTPYQGTEGFSAKGDAVRAALNDWYRTSGAVEGVIDFDKATRDISKPAAFNPAYDSGDHLHPGDAGYEAMANSIDITLFQ